MNDNPVLPPEYSSTEPQAGEAEGGGREEGELHLAEILSHQETYAEMIEKRIRLQNTRPQTPTHMHMAQRIMWKRGLLRLEQSSPDDLQLEDSEENPEETTEVLPPEQPQIMEELRPEPQTTDSPPEITRTSPDQSPPRSPDQSPPRSPVNSAVIVVPPPRIQEPQMTNSPNNRKETTITISESGQDPGKSLLSVSIVFNNSGRRNSAPNRTLQIEAVNYQHERRHSAEKTHEEQKQAKRKKNDMKKKKKKKRNNRIHPTAVFAEKTNEPVKHDTSNEDGNDDNPVPVPVPGPSAEDEETLQKIQELENLVEVSLNDFLGPHREDVIVDEENNDDNNHKEEDSEINRDTDDKHDTPNEELDGDAPNEKLDDDNPVPGPSAEDKETLQKIQELEIKVEKNLDDLLGPDRQDVINEDTNDSNLDDLLGQDRQNLADENLDEAKLDTLLESL